MEVVEETAAAFEEVVEGVVGDVVAWASFQVAEMVVAGYTPVVEEEMVVEVVVGGKEAFAAAAVVVDMVVAWLFRYTNGIVQFGFNEAKWARFRERFRGTTEVVYPSYVSPCKSIYLSVD